jgi:hypothetical protein
VPKRTPCTITGVAPYLCLEPQDFLALFEDYGLRENLEMHARSNLRK